MDDRWMIDGCRGTSGSFAGVGLMMEGQGNGSGYGRRVGSRTCRVVR